MSTLPAKRPAHFEDERDALKRSRKGDSYVREERDRRRDRSRDRDRGHQRRSRSRSTERGRRNGERETERDRGLRNGAREDRDRRQDVRRSTPPREHHRRDRSPRRERSPPRRDRSKDRTREGIKKEESRKDGLRVRSPGRGPPAPEPRNGTPSDVVKTKPVNGDDSAMDVDLAKEADDGVDPDVARVMGFRSFKSTKNTKVPGNDKLYAVRKDKKTEYRQYMNRVGGFNRPLSPSR